MEGNHPNVAEAKKKRKMTSLADVRFDARDGGREIYEKHGTVPKVPPKKITTSLIMVSSQETLL
jgi:hypothetical protein